MATLHNACAQHVRNTRFSTRKKKPKTTKSRTFICSPACRLVADSVLEEKQAVLFSVNDSKVIQTRLFRKSMQQTTKQISDAVCTSIHTHTISTQGENHYLNFVRLFKYKSMLSLSRPRRKRLKFPLVFFDRSFQNKDRRFPNVLYVVVIFYS